MKKKIAFFIALLIISIASVFSEEMDEITLGEIKCYELKDGDSYPYERILRLRYDGDYYLQIRYPYETAWLKITEGLLYGDCKM